MTIPTTITPAKRNALIDALLFGTIWKAEHRLRNWGSRYHGPVTLNRLEEAGLIKYVFGAGGWQLTDAGRSIALGLPDKESSASRQHFVDTGQYLSYRHREELNPPPFAVGDTVRSKHNKSGSQYLIVKRDYFVDIPGWMYSVEVVGGDLKPGRLLDQVMISPTMYELVKPEPEPRDWELLAPVVAKAAVLVALGRGDEVVEDYRDGTPTALELLTELVEAGQ